MKTDIRNSADIELMVNAFYEKLLVDAQLGLLFSPASNNECSMHLPTVCRFWENLFCIPALMKEVPINYTGNSIVFRL